jgi:hypothetical protein
MLESTIVLVNSLGELDIPWIIAGPGIAPGKEIPIR